MRAAALLLVALASAAAEEPRTQPVKDWEDCKECGKKPLDPRFRGYTSGNFHSKFHGNWFKDEGKGPQEWYGTAEAKQKPAPRTVPMSKDVMANKDVFVEDHTADDFHSDKSTRPADVTLDLGVAAAINATGNVINENIVKPGAGLFNFTLPDLQSERHRTTRVQKAPIVMRPTSKVVPCNKTNDTAADKVKAAVVDGPKPFKPCAPGGCEKKEKYTKCVKDPVKLPTEEQRANTEAPQGGMPAVASAGNDTFVRKCRSNWWPHPMCMAENELVKESMPRGKNGTDAFQPSSQGERAVWLEGKTRSASNCAMCETLVVFKVAEDALTPIDCGAASAKKTLAVEQRRSLIAELAELKVELKEAQWNVTHNETVPECPAPCLTPRTDTLPIRQQKVKIVQLKIQRKEEVIERTSTAIVMLADLEAACPRLREHFEQFELEVRAEMSEWSGEKMAAREICRKMTCCSA